MGIRTRGLPEKVKEYLLAHGMSDEMASMAALRVSGFGNREGKEQESLQTAQTMFLAPSDILAIGDLMLTKCRACATADDLKKIDANDLQKEAALRGWRPITPDIALFGRMVTSDAFRDIEASTQVAHAISTHKMEHEFDYFTAVDDLQGTRGEPDESGADMIGDVEFNSACYYKYFSLDIDALVKNLAGPAPRGGSSEYATVRAEARRVALAVAGAFMKAAVFTTPSGKQNTFAAHQLPDGILVEVRKQKMPVSYANAFVDPAVPGTKRDLVAVSLERFAEYVERVTQKYSLSAVARLWFTTRDQQVVGATSCRVFSDLLDRLIEVLESGMSHG
jgi:CRISPR system Cascade subunit CasC